MICKNTPSFKIQLKAFLVVLFFFSVTQAAAATIYDWKGGTSTNWATPGNWAVGGVTQTVNYPGSSGSTDIVQIGVNNTFTNQPTLSGSVTVASLTMGTKTAGTLTVNGTLTVSGNITLNHNSGTGGITYAIAGTGSIACNNFYLGDGTAPPAPFLGIGNSTYLTTLNFSLASLAISQSLYLTTTATKTSLVDILVIIPAAAVNNPVFNFNSGAITVGNQLETVDANDANLPSYLLLFPGTSSSAQFLMNPSSGSTSTLNLSGANALNLDGNAGYVDFYGTAGGTSVVNYNGTSNQEVYTTSAAYSATGRQSANGLDRSPTMYQNLTFSGSATKTADAGNVTVGGNLTLAAGTETVDFATNSPVVTVGGNLVSNTGTTLNQGGTGSMTITGISTNAGMLNQTGSGNITFSGALSNSVSTAVIAQTGTGSITASAGIANSGTISQGSGTIGSITVTGTLVSSGTIIQTSGNITVSSSVTNSGTLTLGTANFTVGGSYTNAGTYSQSTGNTIFNGASPTLIDSGWGTMFNNVYFNGGGTALMSSGNFSVSSTGVLNMANSTTLNANGNLTLISVASGSATVAAIPSGCAITNTVKVQRYISGGVISDRGYRLISSPVYAATVSSNKVYSINYLQAGAYITGYSGTNGGFDKAGNPTIYLYREDQTPSNVTFTSGNFWGISTMNNSPVYNYNLNGNPTVYNIPIGNGVMFFFRGNKASALVDAETVTTYVPQPVTMSASGTLNQGQVTVADWYTPTSAYLGYTGTGSGTNSAVRGFNLVGNPYASSIDWEQYNTSSTTTGIYANNVGITIYTFNTATHNFSSYQKGGIYTNNGTNIVASGQGFFVQAGSGGNPQLIFNESAKTNTQNANITTFMAAKGTMRSLAGSATDPCLRVQLAKDSINTDDIYIGFNQAASAQCVYNEDAPYKQGNGLVSLSSISSDNMPLAINRLPLPNQQGVVIPLSVNAISDGTYTINRTQLEGVPQLYEIWLKDAYKSDSLDMRNNATYTFDLYKSDTNSYGAHRFSLVIRQNPALGLHLLSFTALKAVGGTQIAWTTENEANYTGFTVERSTDGGLTFNALGSFESDAAGNYSFTDISPSKQEDAYRLKLVDLNGTITYSNVVTIMYANTGNTIASAHIDIYPNPATSLLNVAVVPPVVSSQAIMQNSTHITTSANTGNTVYGISIIGFLGQVIKTVTTTQPTWQTNVDNLVPGSYVIEVTDNKNNKVIGKGKFVKL